MKTLTLNIEDEMYPEILAYLKQFPNTIEIVGEEKEPDEEENIFDAFETAMNSAEKGDTKSLAELKEEVLRIYKPGLE